MVSGRSRKSFGRENNGLLAIKGKTSDMGFKEVLSSMKLHNFSCLGEIYKVVQKNVEKLS